MNRVIKIIKEPRRMIDILNKFGLLDFLNERKFHETIYYANTGYKLNLDNPKGFNEKLHWLMLNYHNPLCSTLSDKYEVREYIKNTIGEQYLIPLINVYTNVNEINFDQLPNKFVLKCNHNSGIGMCICNDKSKLDIKKTKKKLKKGLKSNGYKYTREWNYKNIKPLIVCEEYMEDTYAKQKGAKGLIDYKFYCFNGEPKFLYASLTNEDKSMTMNYYDMDFKFASFYRDDHKSLPFALDRPKCFNEMIEISKQLSKNFPFVRVDLYQINNKVYFSELTFTPSAGTSIFSPLSWEEKIGSWLDLSKCKI